MKHQKLEERSHDEDYGQPDAHEGTLYESCLECCGSCSGCLKIYCPCICCCCTSPIYELETSKSGILQSFGRFQKVVKPGMHIINPWTETITEVSMKTVVLNLAPQTVITQDNVSLRIDTVVYYRTINPYKLLYKLGNNFNEVRNFISEMSYSAMRTVVGERNFQNLLEDRKEVADAIEGYVKQSVGTWGLFIENIFIKDLILSAETRQNMQSAAIQKRVSEAQIISAKADVEAAKLLKETSEILNSKSAMQIRYLEALQNIITSNNSKTMFVSLKGK